MANFQITVDEQAFRMLGVQLVIDEPLYNELIDTYASSSPQLLISVVPSAFWPDVSLSQRLSDIHTGASALPIAGYSSAKQSIILPVHPDPERTNKALLHETYHYIDHSNGDSEAAARYVKLLLAGAVTLAVSGAILGVKNGHLGSAVFFVLSLLVILPTIYWSSPHEQAARQFANNKEIAGKYGSFITFYYK